MQHLDLYFDSITALHDFEGLLGPTARSMVAKNSRRESSRVTSPLRFSDNDTKQLSSYYGRA